MCSLVRGSTDDDGVAMRDAGGQPEPLLAGRDLVKIFRGRPSKRYSLFRTKIRAVNDVTISIDAGKTVGIAGESGCGKTTLARLMVGALPPDDGQIYFRGRDVAKLRGEERKTYRAAVQAVFQDPRSAINPRLSVAASIAEPLVRQKDQTKADLGAAVDELLTAVGLEEGVRDNFPHQLSGGMLQRVAIAQALASDPKIIVLDEPVSALDVSIRAQIMNLLQDLRRDYGVSFFMISHDLATLRYLSDEVGVMYLGKLVEFGPAELVFDQPQHPYTAALLSAAPEIRRDSAAKGSQRIVLPGDMPSPEEPTQGCSFHSRCPLWQKLGRPSVCTDEDPALHSTGGRHRVACHFWDATPTTLLPTTTPSSDGHDVTEAAGPRLDPATGQDHAREDNWADGPW